MAWGDSLRLARKQLGITGYAACGGPTPQGQRLLKKTRENYKAGKGLKKTEKPAASGMKKTGVKKTAMKMAVKKTAPKKTAMKAPAMKAVMKAASMKTVMKAASTAMKTASVKKESKQSKWHLAVKQARKNLGSEGFVPVGGDSKEGKALYKEAKRIYEKS